MAVIIGGIIVLVSILVGFSMAGGHVEALIHPSEFITIGGATFGALVIMSPKKVLTDLLKSTIGLLKPSPFGKATYIELFRFLYAVAKMVRRDGLLALDGLVSTPDEAALFKQFPRIGNNHHVRDFVCEALSLIMDGKSESAQLGGWLEEEIKVVEREHHAAVGALAKTADALPGFGIVAAVLGIVVTMQAIGGPIEEIGHKVGAALVGTFLGILMAYGFIAPMAARMDTLGAQEGIFLRAISAGVLALSEGASPKDVVVRARRSVGTECRPNPAELKSLLSGE